MDTLTAVLLCVSGAAIGAMVSLLVCVDKLTKTNATWLREYQKSNAMWVHTFDQLLAGLHDLAKQIKELDK